jgi:hypothetical protein
MMKDDIFNQPSKKESLHEDMMKDDIFNQPSKKGSL